MQLKSQQKIKTAGNPPAGGPGHRSKQTRADVSVGKLLKAAREQRHLSLEAVAEDLSIPVKQLDGLENGDVSMFAAEVYARGAFTKYADFLGIQADHAFMRVVSGAREFVPLRVHTPKPWLKAVMTPRWVLAAGLLTIALLLGSYLAWQVNSFFRLPALALTAPAAGVVEADTIEVQGVAAADAQVAVNGETIPLGSDGSFSLEVPLHRGINVIEVSATNAAGRTRTIKRDVLVPRS